MKKENDTKYEGEELDSMFIEFFSKGGTFKDMRGLSDDAMEAIYAVAYNLYQGGKYEEAEKVFQFLCFYDHFSPRYYMGLAACQQMQQQYDNAIEIFSFASILDSDDPRPMIYIGDCHLANGDKERAKVSYETSIDWASNDSSYADDIARAKQMLENIT